MVSKVEIIEAKGSSIVRMLMDGRGRLVPLNPQVQL